MRISELVKDLFKPSSFVFGFTLCGYGIISFLVSDAETSRSITVPFRILVLGLNALLLVFNLGLFRIFFNRTRKSSSPLVINTIPSLWRSWLNRLSLLFVALYSYRLLNDSLTLKSWTLSREPNEYILFWFLIALIPAFNFLFLEKNQANKYLLIAWLFHCPIVISGLLLDPTQSRTFQEQGRLAATALNPITLGHYGTSLTLLSIYIWLHAKTIFQGAWRRWVKWISIVTALMGLALVFLAASRSPIIALAVCTLLILFSSRKVNLNTLVFLTILVAGLFMISSFASTSGSSFLDRFSSVEAEVDDNSGMTRGGLYRMAWKLIVAHPWLGFGLEIPSQGYPHNLILEAFLTLGFFGGILFSVVLIWSVIKSMRLMFVKRGEWGWLSVLFVQYAIAAMSSGSLYGVNMFWYLMFGILGLKVIQPARQLSQQ
jgi:O-antigen ligase